MPHVLAATDSPRRRDVLAATEGAALGSTMRFWGNLSARGLAYDGNRPMLQAQFDQLKNSDRRQASVHPAVYQAEVAASLYARPPHAFALRSAATDDAVAPASTTCAEAGSSYAVEVRGAGASLAAPARNPAAPSVSARNEPREPPTASEAVARYARRKGNKEAPPAEAAPAVRPAAAAATETPAAMSAAEVTPDGAVALEGGEEEEELLRRVGACRSLDEARSLLVELVGVVRTR